MADEESRMAPLRDMFAKLTDTPPSPKATQAENAYTAANIEVLEGLEPVRRRPGM
jgi:topoisomerase-4 subunit B